MEEIMKDKINFFFFHLAPWNVSKNGILHTNIFHLLLNYPKHKQRLNVVILVISG